MANINKSENIILKYEDNKIKIIGTQIKAVLDIESGKLRKLYFGNEGHGTLHVQIIDEKDMFTIPKI